LRKEIFVIGEERDVLIEDTIHNEFLRVIKKYITMN